MQDFLHHAGARSATIGLLVGLVALSACSTYKPLGQGSTVPWAAAFGRPAESEAAASAGVTVAGKRVGTGEVTVTPVDVPAADLSGQVHRVQRGESLAKIASRHGISIYRLAAANQIEPPYTIYVDQILRLPQGVRTAGPRRSEASGQVHEVQGGETLSAISRRYGVPLNRLVAINDLQPPYHLAIGQKLQLSGEADRQVVAPAPTREPQTIAGAAEQAAPGKTPPLSGDGFLWPVKGKVIGRFGQVDNGERRDGIDIATRKGAPVRAAENGVVAYASDGMRGWGRIILLRHDESYVTTYAHNASLLVGAGEVVRRGQIIARVGDSGSATSPRLHFELRKGRKPLDPEVALVDEGPTEVASTEITSE